MHVVIRADASRTLGHGHVRRCLTLAEAMRERMISASFVCRKLEGDLTSLIEARGFDVSLLEGAAVADEDARDTLRSIRSRATQPDWVVVDHYELDSAWEIEMRASNARIMAIDDLADRVHDCDLLLDQNLVARSDTRYGGKVPAGCCLLLGPRYALLQPDYAALRATVVARRGAVRRILVFFGGGDVGNLTGKTVDAFLSLERPDIALDVVITGSNPHAAAIERQTFAHPNIQLLRDVPTLARLIAQADLSVGAGGSTSWERLCLGLPTVVVTVASNQLAGAAELEQRGLIRWLGNADTVGEPALAQALREVMENGLDVRWSERCLEAVDGQGTMRVLDAFVRVAVLPLVVRQASPADEARILAWANDAATRRNALHPALIHANVHHEWFTARLQDANCRFYVVEASDGQAIGQVRFQRAADEWEVHYALAPMFRGKGLGLQLLKVALQKHRAANPHEAIFGRVRKENAASRKIFAALNFTEHPQVPNEIILYRSESAALENVCK